MTTLTHRIPKTLQARIVSGSIVLLSGSGMATAINLVYNVAVARFLGPTGLATPPSSIPSSTLHLRRHALVSDRLREGGGAAGLARKARPPSTASSIALHGPAGSWWRCCCSVFQTADRRLPEPARFRSRRHHRHRRRILHSAWDAAAATSRDLRLPRAGHQHGARGGVRSGRIGGV